MAMRGRVLAVGRRRRAAARRRRPAACRRRRCFGSGAVARWSPAGVRSTGAASAGALVAARCVPGIDDFLALAAGAVDDGDGLACRAAARSPSPARRRSAPHAGRPGRSGSACAGLPAPGCARLGDDDRPSARRRADRRRTAAQPTTTQPRHSPSSAGQQRAARGSRQLAQRLRRLRLPGRAGRSDHPAATAQILAKSSPASRSTGRALIRASETVRPVAATTTQTGRPAGRPA